MEERSIQMPAEAPQVTLDHAGPAGGLADPRALQILSTEHWSLLSARALVYNEAFARAGMFLSFLSASLVALGLIAAATGFTDGFLMVAATLLALDLFIGLATLGRISGAGSEDIRYLQAMNRVRHAYAEIAPGVERYFVTGHHDDAASVLGVYGPSSPSPLGMLLHGFTTTPGMISVICSGVAGALAAVLAMLATHDPAVTGIAGLAAGVILFVVIVAVVQRSVAAFWRSMPVMFPPEPPER